ncbi:MAG: alpha-amylase family glycosyl hydrolase [Anaerolineales bacterium]
MHISLSQRRSLDLPSSLFTESGRLIPDFSVARRLAPRLNTSAARIYALSLINEAFSLILDYFDRTGLLPISTHLFHLESRLGRENLRTTLLRFVELFPPPSVFDGKETPLQYLDRPQTSSKVHEALKELLLLYLENVNPAAADLRFLFDDALLRRETAYEDLVTGLQMLPFPTADRGENPLEALFMPLRQAPLSLEEQLRLILQTWDFLLDEKWRQRLQRALDFLEEEKTRFAAGSGEVSIPSFSAPSAEVPERITPDRDWMPNLVLITKNVYVWLAQLSRLYQRPIRRLDEIPQEELDRLARWGINGLWLIGLWERSVASRRIKQLMGDEQALGSAYALRLYDIAADLGGWEALHILKQRTEKAGIRLAADMVPNHMAIDSTWVFEKPHYFLSLPYPPYSSYTFNGPDLSDDARFSIYIEDGYYTRWDAAVVFKRLDRQTGEVMYIYHGNDGTSVPWNDTAQIDYLNPEARQAVIETILQVARHFPIIRFDAAMTLVKRHVQRLWHPLPGQGGAIPSRAEHAVSPEEFEKRMPREFWVEVVERVAQEVPDTLLLAEAFWMMEGYFVRNLGMHRVYNSAFMHMLRDEQNAKYRLLMKNALETEPEVLKRFVNFMNNPDERTAIEQFGDGDKYLGICTLMVTLPGLPMFGHGQIEGYREKYGMEFHAPRWQEEPNSALIAAHERWIFPLLHRRSLFSGIEHFALFDFFTPEGVVNEDVFAFSNRNASERALVIYHNRYAGTRGWLRTAVTRRIAGELRQQTLAEALDLPREGYVIFRDMVSGLEYLRSAREIWEKGLYLELAAYRRHVFVDWRFVDGERWEALHRALGERPVPSLEERYQALSASSTQPIPRPRIASSSEPSAAPQKERKPAKRKARKKTSR